MSFKEIMEPLGIAYPFLFKILSNGPKHFRRRLVISKKSASKILKSIINAFKKNNTYF